MFSPAPGSHHWTPESGQQVPGLPVVISDAKSDLRKNQFAVRLCQSEMLYQTWLNLRRLSTFSRMHVKQFDFDLTIRIFVKQRMIKLRISRKCLEMSRTQWLLKLIIQIGPTKVCTPAEQLR